MTESLRGVFYITRGNYKKDKRPEFYNEVSEKYNFIGGYDPTDDTNEDWYMVIDNVTFTCMAAGVTLNTALEKVYDLITKYRTKEHYLHVLSGLDLPTSPIHRRVEEEVFKTWGDYFRPQIKEVEDRAYSFLASNSAVARARKRLRKRVVSVEMETTTPPPAPVTETPTTPPKRKKGLRPVKRHIAVEMT